MSDLTKAIFLSYAREDAAAAHRVAEALRGFGVEVWFDQSELRGGDQWDQKIRGQIKACALFIPIISATTQSRDEAYFRLEWKLADDRSHLMAAGKTFIVPVVIDDTPENGASVPESFGRSQWTRLDGGEPSTAFIEQVKRLLETPRKPALRPEQPRPPTLPPGFRQSAQARAVAEEAAAKSKPALPGWMWGVAVAVIAVAVAGMIFLRQPAPVVPPPVPVAEVKPAPVASVSNDKSIAVLPFANLSTDKENEFFADGVHDDVITNLAKIRALRVISRTSVLAYRDPASRNLKKIAAELGVTTILEGSIRRVGSKVHMNAQLIDARTHEHLWADTFDGDTSDIFALQASLSQKIATALKTTLTPGERTLIARQPTQDAQAYELYQRAKLFKQRFSAGSLRGDYDASIALYEQALARDPNLALAHADLTFVHGAMYWFGQIDPTPERRARAAAELAETQRLAPDAPETRMAQGTFAYLCENDWPKAVAEFQAAEASLPNDDQLRYLLAIAYRRLGRWPEAAEQLERAVALNPHEKRAGSSFIETVFLLRRFTLLPALAPRFLALFPGDSTTDKFFIDAQFELDGDRAAWLGKLAALAPMPADLHGLNKSYLQALRVGDLAAADRSLADPRQEWFPGFGQVITVPASLWRAQLARLRGDAVAAKKFADAARAALAARSWSPRQEPVVRGARALAQVCAGEDGGDQELRQAMEQMAQQDKFLSAYWIDAARTFAAAGHNDEALAALRRLLAGPSYAGPSELRYDPFFAQLKSDPRFEEILKSAKPL